MGKEKLLKKISTDVDRNLSGHKRSQTSLYPLLTRDWMVFLLLALLLVFLFLSIFNTQMSIKRFERDEKKERDFAVRQTIEEQLERVRTLLNLASSTSTKLGPSLNSQIWNDLTDEIISSISVKGVRSIFYGIETSQPNWSKFLEANKEKIDNMWQDQAKVNERAGSQHSNIYPVLLRSEYRSETNDENGDDDLAFLDENWVKLSRRKDNIGIIPSPSQPNSIWYFVSRIDPIFESEFARSAFVGAIIDVEKLTSLPNYGVIKLIKNVDPVSSRDNEVQFEGYRWEISFDDRLLSSKYNLTTPIIACYTIGGGIGSLIFILCISLIRRNNERSSLLRKLEVRKRQLDLVFEGTDRGILILTSGGRCFFANSKASSLLGISKESLKVQPWYSNVPVPDKEDVYLTFNEAIESQRSWKIECRIEANNKPEKWLFCHLIPIRAEEGLKGYMLQFDDITEQKEQRRFFEHCIEELSLAKDLYVELMQERNKETAVCEKTKQAETVTTSTSTNVQESTSELEEIHSNLQAQIRDIKALVTLAEKKDPEAKNDKREGTSVIGSYLVRLGEWLGGESS